MRTSRENEHHALNMDATAQEYTWQHVSGDYMGRNYAPPMS